MVVIRYLDKNAQSLCKITTHPCTWILLHVSAINRHYQGDINTKEYDINNPICIYNNKKVTAARSKKMWLDIFKNVDGYYLKNVDGYCLKMWVGIFKNVDEYCLKYEYILFLKCGWILF